MDTSRGDELVAALIPVADRLIAAVHAMDGDDVAAALRHAALLADSELDALRHLVVLLAGCGDEDHASTALLAWTINPGEYRRLREAGLDSITASQRAARSTGLTASPQEAGGR